MTECFDFVGYKLSFYFYRYFGRWGVFVEIVKELRTTSEKAEAFRR